MRDRPRVVAQDNAFADAVAPLRHHDDATRLEWLGRQIQKGTATNSAPLVWGSAFALGAMGATSLLVIAAVERPTTRGRHQS